MQVFFVYIWPQIECLSMKYITYLGLFLISIITKGQTGGKELYFPEVGWKIQIPNGTTSLDIKQLDSLMQVSTDNVKHWDIKPPSFDGIKVLFAFLDNENDLFGSSISAYDSSKCTSWMNYHVLAKHDLIALLLEARPGINLQDTLSSIEIIDSLPFQLFHIKSYDANKDLRREVYWYSCLRRGVDFSVNIAFADEAVGNQYLSIFQHSTFDKN